MTRESWDNRYRGSGLVWSAQPNQTLVAESGTLPLGRALDLGCGEGRNSIWLAEQGWDVVGVDFSQVAIQRAREIAQRRGVSVEWIVADLNEYDPPKRWFDLVVDLYIHLEPNERRALTSKAARAVAPGGTLLIVGHHIDNLKDGHGGPQEPSLLHVPDLIAASVGELTVVKAEAVMRVVETEDGRFDAIDSLVRAELSSEG